MVSIKLSSFMLGLLVLLHAPINSSAYAPQGRGKNNGIGHFAYVQKELVDDIPAAANRKMGLGGRKMSRKEVEKEKKLNGESSKISGAAHYAKECTYDIEGKWELNVKCILKHKSNVPRKDMDASKNSLERSQDHLNNQNNSNMMGISGSENGVHLLNTSALYSQDTKAISTKASFESSSNQQFSQKPHDHHDIAYKNEAGGLLKADDEIVALMHKDYSGKDQPKPRHRSPIHNHQPND